MTGLGLTAAVALIAVGLCILSWEFLASERSLSGPMRVTCIGSGVILIAAGLYFAGR